MCIDYIIACAGCHAPELIAATKINFGGLFGLSTKINTHENYLLYGISYPYKSCLYTFCHCHPYFILQFYSIIFYTYFCFFCCNYNRRWEVSLHVRAKVVATPLVNSYEA